MVLAALRFGATVLPIPFRAISASFAPLDVHRREAPQARQKCRAVSFRSRARESASEGTNQKLALLAQNKFGQAQLDHRR